MNDEDRDYCKAFCEHMAEKLLADERGSEAVFYGLVSAASKVLAQDVGQPERWPELLLALTGQAMLWADKVNAQNN